MNRILFSLLLMVLAGAAGQPADATSLEPQSYKRAFAALDAGHADVAYSIVNHAHDAALNKVLRGYYLAAPGNNASFSEMADFITDNPDWPGLRDIRLIAEQKIPEGTAPMQIVDWFGTYPPVTLMGVYRYIDALNLSGHTEAAINYLRKRWIDGDFRDQELTAFYTRFGAYLTPNDHWARLDRLVWEEDATAAKRMFGLVDIDMQSVAQTRLALAGRKIDAPQRLILTQSNWRNDPGLQYERLRWLRRNDRDDEAIDILEHAPDELGQPDKWWEERAIIIRRVMDRRDFNRAYRLASDHSAVDAKNYLHAEFLAGWIALRFLHQPETARDHFEALYKHATTPISKSRGAYWLGRTYEAMDDRAAAQEIYAIASSLDNTFYGQLAAARLYGEPTISAAPEPAPPASVRQQFYARDLIQAIEHLHNLGQTARVRTFFKAATDAADEHSDFILLSELANKIGRPDLAIEAAKAATQKNTPIVTGGFPVLSRKLPSQPEPAFTHALIRQESMFNPTAASPAGAQGLMQLMPHTAQAVSQKLGLKYRKTKLCEPDYNLKLGTSFVQNQISSFNGSYILALAGYNAGPSRVREWMAEMGDPRDPRIDPVDWIELIPIAETRNYVQRILENLQVYRARLNGGKAQLLILKDLRR